MTRRRYYKFEQMHEEQQTTHYCVAVPTKAEQQAITDFLDQLTTLPNTAAAALEEPRGQGRPSYDALIEAAITQLSPPLDPQLSLAARARLVAKHILTTTGIDPPSGRCIERHLRQKDRQKVRQKSLPRKR